MFPELYFYGVLLLMVLAIVDLVVGVSNDAVNFLNSAVGSKVAKRSVIMMVAGLGIFIGATFSSGMMEVARNGIFNPQFFTFAEIMAIFMAVMLTDIILLDLFNTFGMPTSTTVSIVFELLGAAVAVAFLKVLESGEAFETVSSYINSSRTITIISGIFLSIAISFAVGAFVQWLSRLLFSFQYEKRLMWFGGIWSGLAMSTISYFLLFKGIKGASFVSKDFIQWVADHTVMLFTVSLITFSLLAQVLISVFRVQVLRGVVLFGTFALAMAFAGNDLVNFIGVPLAGLESYTNWSASGLAPEAFMMDSLAKKVKTETWMLIVAGVVMVLTLWFSKKARTVTETEVNLGRQDDGAERFNPNWLSRGIVWYTRKMSEGISKIIPAAWIEKAESNFRSVEDGSEVLLPNQPAFDLIRATVNLTVASALIAMATSLKLPLSTTYVSFMVAMGTSLSDRAWGRGSAVYRVAGVLNVIGGWFLTAIVAFTAAALFASAIHWLGAAAVFGLVALAIFLITRTFLHHRRQERRKAAMEAMEMERDAASMQHLTATSAAKISTLLKQVVKVYQHALEGLLREDAALLNRAKAELNELEDKNKTLKRRLYKSIRQFKEDSAEASRLYLLVFDLEQDLLQSARLILEESDAYVVNSMPAFKPEQQERLRAAGEGLSRYLDQVADHLERHNFVQYPALRREKQHLFQLLEDAIQEQISGIKSGLYGRRNSMHFFTLILETKDLIGVAMRFSKLFYRIQLMANRS